MLMGIDIGGTKCAVVVSDFEGHILKKERFATTTCEETLANIFAAAERLGAKPEETAVYEDAWYAVRTAKTAGFHVIGIYDTNSDARWEDIRNLADEVVLDWNRGPEEGI